MNQNHYPLQTDQTHTANVFQQICQEARAINLADIDMLCEDSRSDVTPTIDEYNEWIRIRASVNADM